jgi:transcriptional regulator
VNDLSAFDGDAKRERQICDLRVKGKTEREVCAMLGCTVADIHRALDRAAQASMTPAARVRGIYIDAARLERIQQVFIALVESADDKAAMVVIRAQERKATLMGDNPP